MYNYDSYKVTFDTSQKRLEERVIARSIFKSLNNNPNFNLNDVSYQEYLKFSKLDYVMKHFGDTIRDPEFKAILNNIGVSNNKFSSNTSENSHNKQLGLKTSAGAIFKEK